MTTNTDLANRALSYIGESKISNIDDTGSKAARVCKEFLGDIIKEVLRSFRWNCATRRAELSEILPAPTIGPSHAYALPTDFIRLLEVNGEQWNGSEQFQEIEGRRRLVTSSNSAKIRYIASIGVVDFDPMLAESIATKLAMVISVPLTANLNMQSQMANLYNRAIKQARQVDAIETGSRENNAISRLIDNSPTVNARFSSSLSVGSFINRYLPGDINA